MTNYQDFFFHCCCKFPEESNLWKKGLILVEENKVIVIHGVEFTAAGDSGSWLLEPQGKQNSYFYPNCKDFIISVTATVRRDMNIILTDLKFPIFIK